MTLQALIDQLQVLAHEGHAQEEVCVDSCCENCIGQRCEVCYRTSLKTIRVYTGEHCVRVEAEGSNE